MLNNVSSLVQKNSPNVRPELFKCLCLSGFFPGCIEACVVWRGGWRGLGYSAKDEPAKTNGFSPCYLAAGALNGSLKTQHLRTTIRWQRLCAAQRECDRKVCDPKSQLSVSRYWGHNSSQRSRSDAGDISKFHDNTLSLFPSREKKNNKLLFIFYQ